MKKTLTILVLLLSIKSIAATTTVPTAKTTTTYTEVQQLTPAETIRAKTQKLSLKEVVRAKRLRQQYQGLISSDISDIELLGIFAKTEADKEKYARLFAQLIRETTQQVLTFQKMVNQAHLDIYGNASMFDYKSNKLTGQNRTRYTINIKDCHNSCLQQAKQLVAQSYLTPVDFYFNASNDNEIRIFATKLGIKVEQVNSKQITLNYATNNKKALH